MPDAVYEVAHLIAYKFIEINMRDNEFYTLYLLIEARATVCIEANSVFRFITDEYKEADEKRESDENENEMRHTYERAERRTNWLIRTRSPNFCVASLRKS